MVECFVESNKTKCACTYNCKRRGKCCECVEHHRQRQQIPACFFPADVEKTYDRSFARFIKACHEKSS